MSQVRIIHAYDLRFANEVDGVVEGMQFLLGDDWKAADGYRVVYEYDGDADLGVVFRRNNAVDGSEENVKRSKRSLSVGDAIGLDDGSVHVVMPLGFYELSTDERILVACRTIDAALDDENRSGR